MPPGPTGKPVEKRRDNLSPDHSKIPHNDPLRIVIQGVIIRHPTLGTPIMALQYVDGPFEDPVLCHGLLGLARQVADDKYAELRAACAVQQTKNADSIAVPTDEQLEQTMAAVAASNIPAPKG
jgi:hypothetical protein